MSEKARPVTTASGGGARTTAEVDVVGPGVHIFTTDITGAAGYVTDVPGNYKPDFNGTSSATPHVACLMALILSVDPDLRSWEVEDIVKMTADDLGPAGRDDFTGHGRINARRALEAASKVWYDVSVAPEFLGAGQECFMRANVRIYNPGINTVRIDAVTVTSLSPDGNVEIDRFEYQPNPDNMLAPLSGQDVRLHMLLRANGDSSSWSYRWALSFSYTFWRPSAPALPLSRPGGSEEVVLGQGVTHRQVHRGGAEGGSPKTTTLVPPQAMGMPNAHGDLVAIDRGTRTITVVVR